VADKNIKIINMKKHILLAVLLLLSTECSSQKNKKMEIFNLNEFTQKNDLLKEKIIVKDSVIEKLGKDDEMYYKLKINRFDPFNNKIYYFKNLNIKNEGKFFYDVPTLYKEYDYNGRLLKEIDFNLGRSFSIDDLNIKMKNEFQIDLLQNIENKGISITRNSDGNICYAVVIKNYFGKGLHRSIYIDVNNGNVLQDGKIYYKK
jgi:hypothetical protein